ncbi:MAG: hypothetical protein QOE16_1765 [Microbacteriaceae bacterium]|jgi:hypothetical protein|nr:hypothetical protein [Microbacteriaceae bacterium]
MAHEGAVVDRVGARLLTALERRARVELDARRGGIKECRGDLIRRQQICMCARCIGHDHIRGADGGFEIFHPTRTWRCEFCGTALHQIEGQHTGGLLPRASDVAARTDEHEAEGPWVALLTQRVQVGQHLTRVVHVGHRVDHGSISEAPRSNETLVRRLACIHHIRLLASPDDRSATGRATHLLVQSERC